MSGRVVDAAGSPLEGVCVYVDRLDGSYAQLSSCTGADGTYAFAGVSPEGYKLGYYPPGEPSPTRFWYLGASSEATATPVEVGAGELVALSDMPVDTRPATQAAEPATPAPAAAETTQEEEPKATPSPDAAAHDTVTLQTPTPALVG